MNKCALRPDAQAFDEVQIRTVPRYKQSGLSGDEWRISAQLDFMRKGKIICSEHCRDIETACGMAYSYLMQAMDKGNAYFAGDGIHCDQEGCSELATVKYQRKHDYDRSARKGEPGIHLYRHFCEKHKTRGDCGFDDSDTNYTPVPLAGEGS